MARNPISSFSFTRLLPRLCGVSILVLLLVILRFLFLRFPFGAAIVETAFKYLSIAYLAGRLVDWFLQVVARHVSSWVLANQQQEEAINE
jgi:hypothetical protein